MNKPSASGVFLFAPLWPIWTEARGATHTRCDAMRRGINLSFPQWSVAARQCAWANFLRIRHTQHIGSRGRRAGGCCRCCCCCARTSLLLPVAPLPLLARFRLHALTALVRSPARSRLCSVVAPQPPTLQRTSSQPASTPRSISFVRILTRTHACTHGTRMETYARTRIRMTARSRRCTLFLSL